MITAQIAQYYGQRLCFSIYIHYIRSSLFDIFQQTGCLFISSLHVVKCGGFFLSLPNKSDNEYGTSKPPSTLHYLRCRNPRYDDSHLGNTRNYLLLQTQRIQVSNEGRTQRQRPTRHRQGSMVRKQNERTLILQ